MFLSREALEARECATHAPYAMLSGESRGRVHAEEEHAYRTAFQRDRDRVIHTTAFRRLEYKTQVFVNHEGDHFRTRLTHTIEVATIARCIARVLRLNEDLAEAIALAHDLGHTPFGHSGEEALSEMMAGNGGFEHNLHGLRVVDVLEHRYPHFRGLNLTWELRESMAKHTTVRDRPAVTEFDPAEPPLLEAQAVEAADEIAYNNHDLADGLEMGTITGNDLLAVPLWAKAYERIQASFPEAPDGVKQHQTIAALINLEVTDLIEHTYARLQETGVASIDDVRRCGRKLVSFSPGMEADKKLLEAFLVEKVYHHYRVVRMSEKAKRFIRELFTEYVRHPGQLPPLYQECREREGEPRAVCDYIASMTDRFAQDEYMRLFYPHERV